MISTTVACAHGRASPAVPPSLCSLPSSLPSLIAPSLAPSLTRIRFPLLRTSITVRVESSAATPLLGSCSPTAAHLSIESVSATPLVLHLDGVHPDGRRRAEVAIKLIIGHRLIIADIAWLSGYNGQHVDGFVVARIRVTD